MKILLLLLLCLATPITAQYDMFTFNMSFFCGHNHQYNYDATFNIRDWDEEKSIQSTPIGKAQGTAIEGITSLSLTGIYEADPSKAPMWEPIVEMKHSCVTKNKGFNTLTLQFAPSPALRDKTRYIYKYYLDITDKKGNRVIDAEITKVGPNK